MYILTKYHSKIDSWIILSHFRGALSCSSSGKPLSTVIVIPDCIEIGSESCHSPLKGILVYELADAGRGDAEGLDVDGALLVDGQHVLQRVHLLAYGRTWVAPVAPGVLAAPP